MQDELDQHYPSSEVQILAVNEFGHEAGNAIATADTDLPLLQFSGFCPNCTGPQPTSETVGVLGIDFSGNASGEWTLDYEFAAPSAGGVTRTDNIIRLSDELACSN